MLINCDNGDRFEGIEEIIIVRSNFHQDCNLSKGSNNECEEGKKFVGQLGSNLLVFPSGSTLKGREVVRHMTEAAETHEHGRDCVAVN